MSAEDRTGRPVTARRVAHAPTPTSFGSSPQVRKRMQEQRVRDTKPELAVRSLLHRRGLRFRVDRAPIPALRRRADIVFSKARVAVFIDGCFWHACPQHGNLPKTNTTFWAEKLETNRARDRDTDQKLTEAGWTSLRFWEHEPADSVANTVERYVRDTGHSPAAEGPRT